MSLTIKVQPSQLISQNHGELITTSLVIAEAFGKLHKNIIRDIEALDVSEEFRRLNFELCHKINELQNGKPQKYFTITKDGFMFLVMGFTGKKAAAWKEAFINAFNQMAEQLNISELEQINDLQARIQQLEAQAPIGTLTPEQQRHIQETVAKIKREQGIHYSSTYHNIKTKFQVGSYKDIKQTDYPALCQYLSNNAPAKPKQPKNRDELCFTKRDSQGRLINFTAPPQTNDWHQAFQAGQHTTNELKSMLTSQQQHTQQEGQDATVYALRQALVTQFEAQGYLCGFLDMIARYAIKGMQTSQPLVENKI